MHLKIIIILLFLLVQNIKINSHVFEYDDINIKIIPIYHIIYLQYVDVLIDMSLY